MNFLEQKDDDDSQDNKEEEKKAPDVNIIRATLAQNDFVFLRPIGKGGFASVFLIFSNQYNINFVVKVSDYKGSRKNSSRDSRSEFDLNEIKHLINLNHPNIINMYKYFTDECYLYIVLEYCEGGSLDDLIKQNGPVRPPTLYNYCYQILTALKHCHDLKISHSDIKPANVLIDKNKRLKLADFGLSKGFSPKLIAEEGNNKNYLHGKNGEILTKKFGGSKPYMSPELIQLNAYDPFKADIWSLGVTFYQLATGHLPWNTYDLKEMRMSITMGVFSFQNAQLPPAFCNIIHRMLEVKPSKRATLEWLLEQSIFSQSSIMADKNTPVCRSPSFGSQLGSFASNVNVNSFKMGNRPNGNKIKLGHRSRNNSSLNIMERNYNFNTFSSDTGDNDPKLDKQNLPNVPGFNDEENKNSINFNNQNRNLHNPNSPNLNLINPHLLNQSNPVFQTKTSSNNFGKPNIQNLRIPSNGFANQSSTDSSNIDLLNNNFNNSNPSIPNIPNSNKLNLSGRHLLYPENNGATPSQANSKEEISNSNIHRTDSNNRENHTNHESKGYIPEDSNDGACLMIASNQRPKLLRGKGMGSAPKTFV